MDRENERMIPDERLEEVVGGTGLSVGAYIWPVPSFRNVIVYFGERTDGGLSGGIEIGGGGISGAAVVAADGGAVDPLWYGSGGWGGGYGTYCVINHDGGRSTVYAHLSAINVRAGEEVSRGQVIGYVGATGDTTHPCLYFETRLNGVRYDPLSEY